MHPMQECITHLQAESLTNAPAIFLPDSEYSGSRLLVGSGTKIDFPQPATTMKAQITVNIFFIHFK
jgi:hypothetical protein